MGGYVNGNFYRTYITDMESLRIGLKSLIYIQMDWILFSKIIEVNFVLASSVWQTSENDQLLVLTLQHVTSGKYKML